MPNVRLLHRRNRDSPPHSLRSSGMPRDNLECSCRHLRPILTACSLLLSSPPSVTAGSVNNNIEPCPAVLLTNIRPPCMPTTSLIALRLFCTSVWPVVCTPLSVECWGVLLGISGATPAPVTEILTITSCCLPRENSAVIPDPASDKFAAALISSFNP